MAASERSNVRPLDAVALAHVLGRLRRAAQPPWLHVEVARRMAERLPVIRMQPRTVVDWEARLGGGRTALRSAYPRARIVEVDAASPPAVRVARRWWAAGPFAARAASACSPADLGEAQAELLWSNMTLHGAIDPLRTMRQWLRVLAIDGCLMFSTLGPGSLRGLRELYGRQGWPVPCAPFVDMHDLGDMLIEAGFAAPVMDQEILTLHWASGAALLAELRTLGGNVDPRRHPGLRGPRWRGRLAGLLEAGSAGRVALEFEIVYGNAFRAPPGPPATAGTTVPLEDLRATIRQRRRRAG